MCGRTNEDVRKYDKTKHNISYVSFTIITYSLIFQWFIGYCLNFCLICYNKTKHNVIKKFILEGFMNKVEPIRDAEKLQQIKDFLYNRNPKYGLMFTLGINTGLRVSDLLNLKVADVINKHIIITEQKTGKYQRILINHELRKEIDKYIQNRNLIETDFLIQSQKGINKPLSRIQAYNILNIAANACGITDRIGTHTMRKTFGFWYYKKYKDVALLQEIFGHSSQSITLRYIGINSDIIDKSREDFYI